MSFAYLVIYQGRPEDPEAFLRYYIAHHLPIVWTFPNIRKVEVERGVDGGDVFMIARFTFDSLADLKTAIHSPQREAARRDMAKIAQDSAETQRRLMNTGQADETEVLEAEVEAQRMRMAARMQENTLREEWRSLAAVVGKPDLPLATVAGELEKGWPELNEEQAVEAIAKESPAVRIADTAEARAQSALARAKLRVAPSSTVSTTGPCTIRCFSARSLSRSV